MSYHISTLKKLSGCPLQDLINLSKTQQDNFRKDEAEIDLAEEEGRTPNLIYKYISEEDKKKKKIPFTPSLANGLISLISLEENYIKLGSKKKQKIHRLFISSPDSQALSSVGWVLNEDLKQCLCCKAEFTYLKIGGRRTRRHCRACGDLICNFCTITELEETIPVNQSSSAQTTTDTTSTSSTPAPVPTQATPTRKKVPVVLTGVEGVRGVIVCKTCAKKANGNQVEIIGNIYNAPSLLKIKKKSKPFIGLPLKMLCLPAPGFVIKCKTKDTKCKVFINVYYHQSVVDENLSLYKYLPPDREVFLQNYEKSERDKGIKDFKFLTDHNTETNLRASEGKDKNPDIIDEGTSNDNHRYGYFDKDSSGQPDRFSTPVVYIGSKDLTTDRNNEKCQLFSVIISDKYFINHHKLLKFNAMKDDKNKSSIIKKPLKQTSIANDDDDEDEDDEMSILFSGNSTLKGIHLPIYHASITHNIFKALQLYYTDLHLDELTYSFPKLKGSCKGNPIYYPEIFTLNQRSIPINLCIPFEPFSSLSTSEPESSLESTTEKNFLSISNINDFNKKTLPLLNDGLALLNPLSLFKSDNTNALIEKEFLSMQLREASYNQPTNVASSLPNFPATAPPTLQRKGSNASLVSMSNFSDVSDFSTTSKLFNTSGVNGSPIVLITSFFSSSQLESSYSSFTENKKKMFLEFYKYVLGKLYNNYTAHTSKYGSVPEAFPASYPIPINPSLLKLPRPNFPIGYIFPLLLIADGCFQIINELNLPLLENELLISSSINFPDILLGYQVVLSGQKQPEKTYQFPSDSQIVQSPKSTREYVDMVKQFYLDYNPNLYLITGVRKNTFKRSIEYRLTQVRFSSIDNDVYKNLEPPYRLLPGNLPEYFANISLVHIWKTLKRKDDSKGFDEFKTLRKVLPFANKK